jgi:hypothetical protein
MRALAALAVILAVIALAGSESLAHERRTVGPYQLVVGFVEEPAFLGGTNGVSLRVTDTRSTPPAPVEGLHETLEVEVFHGGLTRSLALRFSAVFGQPGAYAAHFVPTAPGAYIFRIHGKIGDLALDERFESGPGRFDEVEAVTDLQYPDQVPVGDDLGRTIADLRATIDQLRLLAAAAVAIAIGAIVVPLVRSRRA